jgi:ABC-type nitrate/sulfonate/bicarbonate transport system permease component
MSTLATASAQTSTATFSRSTLARLIAGVAILAVWELVARLFAPAFIARPSGIFAVLPRVLASGPFVDAVGITLLATAEGLAIALVLGTVIGLLMGHSTLADQALRLWINGFNAMPMIVILPLVSLWFGYTSLARLATIVFAAIFAVIINSAEGAQAVPREYLEVGRSFRSAPRRVLFDIVLPASTPYLLAGLRLAAGRALIGAIVAEFFTAIPGLGYFILFNSRTFHHNEAFVAVIFLAAFGVGFDTLVSSGTRHLLPWYRRDERPN